MEPMTLAALAQLAIGGAQTLGGLVMGVPDRPQYTPPAALSEMVANANRDVNSMAPGQAQAQERARVTTANNAYRQQQVGGSSSALINGIGSLQLAENRSMADIYQRGLSYQERAKQRQTSALSQMAGAQNQEFQTNQMSPYLDAVNFRDSLTRSGILTSTDAGSSLAAIAQMNLNQRQPKQPVPLPSAPQAQNYSLSEMTNMDANESWLRLQERMRRELNP